VDYNHMRVGQCVGERGAERERWPGDGDPTLSWPVLIDDPPAVGGREG